MSPTARSLKRLRDDGYSAVVVERFNWYTKTRHDAFGFDIIAIHKDIQGVLGVQTTTGDNAAKRITKLLGIPEVEIWLQAGNRAVVHSWSKRGDRGSRKLWTCVERELTLEMFEDHHEHRYQMASN